MNYETADTDIVENSNLLAEGETNPYNSIHSLELQLRLLLTDIYR